MLINGSCHCENIRFVLDWEPDPAEIVARACTCSFCVKHGNVWTAKPDARIEISIRDSAVVVPYEFGTKTAQFQVCKTCGVVPVVTSMIEERLYAVVNTNTFDAASSALVRRIPTTLDGESTADRLDRRRRNWISHVTLKQAKS